MNVYIRPITEDDTELILQWRNSDFVRSHSLTKAPISRESHLKYFKEKVLTGLVKQYIVECIEPNTGVVTYPIATIYLKDFDKENHRCELCVFTSNDAEWVEESQIIAMKMLIQKAFDEFGIHKIYSHVFCRFPEEVKLLEEVGLKIECTLKEEAKGMEGDYEDLYRMTVIKK